MANFPRVKPSGWSLFDILASALMNQLDIDHSKSVNGDDGGTWGGAVILTGATLSGTSQVNTSGQVTTTATVTGNVVHAVTDVTAAGDVIATDSLKGWTSMAQKVQPIAIASSTVDVNATLGIVGPLDFTTNDNFEITIIDNSGPSTVAQLGQLTIGATTNANPDKEVKTGAKITLRFKTTQPAGAQTSDGASWPASFVFKSEADKALDLLPGQFSWFEMRLEQVGTPASPSFLVDVFRS